MNKCEQYCRTIKRMCNSGGEISIDYAAYLADAWQDINDTITYNQGLQYTESVTTIPYTFQHSNAGFPVLAPNDYIYIIPGYDSYIYKLDTTTDTITTIQSISGDRKWISPIYHAGTKCIYAAPYKHESIFKLNTQTDTVTYVGNFGTDDYKYRGSSIAPNEHIYMFPNMTNTGTTGKIMDFDPYTETWDYIDTGISGASLYNNATLATGGIIYGLAGRKGKHIKLDTNNNNITLFNAQSYGESTGGSYCNNGLLYIAGYTADTVSYNGTGSSYSWYGLSNNYGGIALAPNGVAYLISISNSNGIGRIDIITNSKLSWVTANTGYQGAILAPNMAIYAISQGGTTGVQKITITMEGGRNFKESTLLSPFLNKY